MGERPAQDRGALRAHVVLPRPHLDDALRPHQLLRARGGRGRGRAGRLAGAAAAAGAAAPPLQDHQARQGLALLARVGVVLLDQLRRAHAGQRRRQDPLRVALALRVPLGLRTQFAPSPLESWLAIAQRCLPSDEPPGYECHGAFHIWVTSFYFVVATITSVGYGDIRAFTQSSAEQALATVIMLVGAIVWGDALANFCSVVANMNPERTGERQTLRQLNAFMRAQRLPSALQKRLRSYFFQTRAPRRAPSRPPAPRHRSPPRPLPLAARRGRGRPAPPRRGRRASTERRLLAAADHLVVAERHRELLRMSPALQGEVSIYVHEEWLLKVWFFRKVESDFLIQVALHLTALVFSPGEFAPPGFLYIIHSGIASCDGRWYSPGLIWGDDVLLYEQAENSAKLLRAHSFLGGLCPPPPRAPPAAPSPGANTLSSPPAHPRRSSSPPCHPTPRHHPSPRPSSTRPPRRRRRSMSSGARTSSGSRPRSPSRGSTSAAAPS